MNNIQPKFRIGQRVKIKYKDSKPVFGTVMQIVKSDTLAYGIMCEGYGPGIYMFNERVVFAPGE